MPQIPKLDYNHLDALQWQQLRNQLNGRPLNALNTQSTANGMIAVRDIPSMARNIGGYTMLTNSDRGNASINNIQVQVAADRAKNRPNSIKREIPSQKQMPVVLNPPETMIEMDFEDDEE